MLFFLSQPSTNEVNKENMDEVLLAHPKEKYVNKKYCRAKSGITPTVKIKKNLTLPMM